MAIVASSTAGRRVHRSTRIYGVALVDLSTGEFDVAEYAGPEGLAALRSEIAVLRPREIVVASGYDVARGDPGDRADRRCRSPRSTAGISSSRSARQTLLDQLRVQSLEGFGLERRQAGGLRRRRAGPPSSRHPEGRARARAQRPAAPAGRRPADRSDHAQAPRDRAGDGRRPQPDRCSTRSIARSRRWAAGCSAPGCCVR